MADNNAAPTIDQLALSSLNTRDCITHLHQEATDLLHFQSHIQLQGLILLPPPATGPLNNETHQQLAAHIRKEQKALRQICLLIERAEDLNCNVLELLKETTDNGWNNQAWQV